jgi:hypothetical protein
MLLLEYLIKYLIKYLVGYLVGNAVGFLIKVNAKVTIQITNPNSDQAPLAWPIPGSLHRIIPVPDFA